MHSTHRSIGSLATRSRTAALALCAAAVASLTLLAAPGSVRADGDEDLDEISGPRLGLSNATSSPASLLGFLDRERLDHSRGLSLGFASWGGSSPGQAAGAAYTDLFTYRMRDNLRVALALQYRFQTMSRTIRSDSGDFSVLPSFALDYTPTDNTSIRLSYGRLGHGYGYASPFGLGRPFPSY